MRDLHVRGDRHVDAVRGLGFEVGAGEIVGVAGVSGNGQRELAEAIAGLRTPLSGSISVGGVALAGASAADVRAAGLGYIPEERMRDGVVPEFSVEENILLTQSDGPAFARWAFSAAARSGDTAASSSRSSASRPRVSRRRPGTSPAATARS